ncbi:MAG TPA: MFS transporter [Capillimicrobium sp.]|nr:MFS transporter [Capillimicrobium sp.]
MWRLHLAAFAYFLGVGLGVPTLPRLVAGPLHGSGVAVGWAVGVLSIAAVAARPLAAPAARRWPASGLLAVGALAAGAGLLGLAWADSLAAVLACRVVAGVGEALFFVTATSAVFRLAAGAAARRAQQDPSVAVYAGLLLGPVAAEALRPAVGLDAIWVLAAAACAAASVAAAGVRLPPEAPTPRERFAGAVRAAAVPGLALAAATWGTIAFQAFLALAAEHEGHGDVTVPFVLFAAVVIGARTLGRRALGDAPPARLAVAASLSAGAGLAVVAWSPTAVGMAVAAILVGAGEAIVYPALVALVVDGLAEERRTSTLAAFTGFLDAALATGAPALGLVLELGGFGALYAVAALICAAGAVPLLPMTRTTRSDPVAV